MPTDHPARFLREFVAELDLAVLGFAMPIAMTGRSAYAPDMTGLTGTAGNAGTGSTDSNQLCHQHH